MKTIGIVSGILWVVVIFGMFLPKTVIAGSLEPPAAPGPTMKTLDQIPPTWSHKLPTAERFVLVMPTTANPTGEAVLDKETGLVWARRAYDGMNLVDWYQASDFCYTLYLGGRMGWRLPSIAELTSLVEMNASGLFLLPTGSPFTNVGIENKYWSSTTLATNSTLAWVLWYGRTSAAIGIDKTLGYYVWPVRGGQ